MIRAAGVFLLLPTHCSCPGLQSAPLALTLAPLEGLELPVLMMEDPAGEQLSFHPALWAQAQGAAAAVASALLLLWAGQDPLCHLCTVHLPAHHGSLRRVAGQQAGQRGRAPGELLRGGGKQRDWGSDHGASWRGEQRHTRSRLTSTVGQTAGHETLMIHDREEQYCGLTVGKILWSHRGEEERDGKKWRFCK